MPELPEVETIRRQLEPKLVGQKIATIWSHPSAKFTPAHEIAGAEFTYVQRRGKYLLLGTDDARELVVHLGMTGSLICSSPGDHQFGSMGVFDLAESHVRARWLLHDTTKAMTPTGLTFRDIRRFGRIRVVPAGEYESIPTLAHAGPEPFDPNLTPALFHRLLSAGSSKVKTRLLSQRPIAGVGNIYADEALWMAGINPSAKQIGRQRAALLLDSIRAVLSQGIDNGGTTLNDYRNADGGRGNNQLSLTTYGRKNLPCLRCGNLLISSSLDGRTSTWCPKCQNR